MSQLDGAIPDIAIYSLIHYALRLKTTLRPTPKPVHTPTPKPVHTPTPKP